MRLLLCTCEGLLAWMALALVLLLPEVNGNCLASEIPSYVTFDGKKLNDSYPIGTTLRSRCIPSYTATALSIQCRNDSTWSETCQRTKCKVPVIENGKINDLSNLTFGDEVSFTCNEGYTLLGKNTSRCALYGSNIVDWVPEPPHCERLACERPPTIDNGSYGDYDDHYTVGTVVKYTCNKDFSLIGQSSLECIVTEDGRYGKWNQDPPQCKVVECDRPRIENGKLTSGFQASYKYDHVLKYICNVGYTVLESELTTCIANSTWHPTPKCVKVSATTAVPVHPGGNTTSGTTQRPGVTTFTAETGTTQWPGLTTSTAETGITQRPGLTTSTTESGPNSATIAVGKLSLIVALLILTV